MKNDQNPYTAPADTTVATANTTALPHKGSGRFGVMLQAIAWAYWGWLLSDLWRKPVGDLLALLVFASVTLTAGVCGHLLYRYVLRWRGTVLLSLLLSPLPILGLLGLLFGSVGQMFDILALPIDFVLHQNWTHRITFSLPVFFSIVILSMAHPLKPSLPKHATATSWALKVLARLSKIQNEQVGPDGVEPRAPIGMDADRSNPVKSRVYCR